jgi:hypothetical protein
VLRAEHALTDEAYTLLSYACSGTLTFVNADKHLTPNLEPKTSPKYLSWYPFFRAEHMKPRLLMRDIHLGALNIHSGPSLRQY